MKIIRQHIIFALLAIMTLFASCSKDEAEVIPRKKMAKIYAEMLVTDQWISSTPGVRLIADTSLVYEPILEKYGYDSEDYRKSIDKYMDDPERFSRIFRTSGEIIEDRIKELRKEQARLDALDRLPKVKSDLKLEEFIPFWVEEPYVHYYDSLDVYMDVKNREFIFVPVERADTVYDRIRMIKPVDSLAVAADSLAPDSLKVDSLKVDSSKVDSLNKASSPIKKPALKVPDTFRTRKKEARRPQQMSGAAKTSDKDSLKKER